MKISSLLTSKQDVWFKAIAVAIALPLGAWITTAKAEQVAIPLGQQGKAWHVESPRTGLSKAAVEAKYGSPVKRMGPIGDPPIYVWDYPEFTVYFESDTVIHSVVKPK